MPKIVSENVKRAKRHAAETRRRTLQVMTKFGVSADEAAKVVADLGRAKLLVRVARLVRLVDPSDTTLLRLAQGAEVNALEATQAALRRVLQNTAAQNFMDKLEQV